MTAAQPQGLDRRGVRSLELRWILRGQLTRAVKGWFGRFPTETMALEDAYLEDPYLARRAGAGGEDVPWQPLASGGGGASPRPP